MNKEQSYTEDLDRAYPGSISIKVLKGAELRQTSRFAMCNIKDFKLNNTKPLGASTHE